MNTVVHKFVIYRPID